VLVLGWTQGLVMVGVGVEVGVEVGMGVGMDVVEVEVGV
jgi:hypothetical protein